MAFAGEADRRRLRRADHRAVQNVAVPGEGWRRAGVGPGAGPHGPGEQRERLLAGQHTARERFHRPVRYRRRHCRRLARPQHPDHPVRHIHRSAPARRGRRSLHTRERGPCRRRPEAGAARRGHARLHHQPRLQPGRVRRAAGDRQPALRGLLPGEAAVLPGELRLLRVTADAVLLPASARSAVRRADHRQVRQVGDGRAGGRRSGARA